MRTLYKDQEAQDFYERVTGWKSGEGTYTFPHKDYAGVGGYYKEGDIWVAYDFCDGTEVFNEPFDDEKEAEKYAKGQIATTQYGLTI